MQAKGLFIHTIGCQMNVYDSAKIESMLQTEGYQTVDSLPAADLVIVNTCAIRAKAEQKAFSFIGRLAELKRQNPNLIIGAGGCVAQQQGQQVLKRAPYVDLVFGTHAIARLPAHINSIAKRKCRIVDIEMSQEIDEVDQMAESGTTGDISKFVTIMRGCDNYCAYCVVPYVRGRETSRKPEKILSEIKQLVRSGVREVTLLGQNVNSYGKKEGLCSFPQLLSYVNDIEGIWRIRFTTSHPKDLSTELIEAFKQLKKLCHHIHLPVQSGSDHILKRMNRGYTCKDYLRKIERLRRACPDRAVTSDFIVGFPGETTDDFKQTLALIKAVEYDGAFAFMYSDRSVAPASRFDKKVSEDVKKERLQILLEIQNQYTLKKNQALLGSVQEVLVEGYSKQPGDNKTQWTGRISTNKIVNFISPSEKQIQNRIHPGTILPVKIENALAHSLWGQMVLPESAPTELKGEQSYAA